MTDHPRFHIGDVGPDERYRQHHGAPQVELVLRIVDWWREHRRRKPFDEQQTIPSSNTEKEKSYASPSCRCFTARQ